MTPRIAALLQKDHLIRFGALPNIAEFSLPEIEALDPFALFLVQNRIAVPQPADIAAFVEIRAGGKPACPDAAAAWLRTWHEEMTDLRRCLERLRLAPDLLAALDDATESLRHRGTFRKFNHGLRRAYPRTVSVPPEEFPDDWRATLARLRVESAFAKDILNRMEQRLGMFVWSARQAGLAPDLADAHAEQQFYDDLAKRSREKAIEAGEDPATARPRWAYLRGAAEELRRFAQAHGLEQRVAGRIDRNLRRFAELESRQTPLKMFDSELALGAPQLLADTMDRLETVPEIRNPEQRHHARMKACAIGITIPCPPRARDFAANLVWGDGVYYDAASEKYRFDYSCHKTHQRVRMTFEPEFGAFLDALLLGDNDPRHLPQLRARAIAEKQRLFIKYDLEPVRYGWIGSVWEEVVGSGSQLMRTILQTEMADYGEAGMLYGQIALGHKTEVMRQKKYRDRRAKERSAAHAGAAMASRAASLGGGIEDLL